jgi:2-amino-4-hydroxy-6-hydroxymethyldihydropteridine diphosphokinase
MENPGKSEYLSVYLGLGSNQGDRLDNIVTSIRKLSLNTIVEQISSVYETEPVGYTDQPLFLNAVVSVRTELEPLELLHFIKQIEVELGRRPDFRNAPRTTDIDILFYGDMVLQSGELTIPHPRIVGRAFVLVPLAEIAPEFIHPTAMKKVDDLLAGVSGVNGVNRMEGISLKEAIG